MYRMCFIVLLRVVNGVVPYLTNKGVTLYVAKFCLLEQNYCQVQSRILWQFVVGLSSTLHLVRHNTLLLHINLVNHIKCM